ncbi:MAG: VOC family protein [Leptolyngbyaceae cyanobacterium SL_1_1]|nr:VOC family protein [Leptolyngbyaceae cyanobacterium RM1_1_2]NJO08395.1 VOC family protein [Leptolyngbyaceae cyanobacterium SL_1_1]
MSFEHQDAFLTLASTQLETLVQFYQQLFNQEPKFYSPGKFAEFQLASLRLAIFAPKPDHQAEFGPTAKGAMSLCLEVDDLERAIAHLQIWGYPATNKISEASHGREIYAYDPDGNRLILHQSR